MGDFRSVVDHADLLTSCLAVAPAPTHPLFDVGHSAYERLTFENNAEMWRSTYAKIHNVYRMDYTAARPLREGIIKLDAKSLRLLSTGLNRMADGYRPAAQFGQSRAHLPATRGSLPTIPLQYGAIAHTRPVEQRLFSSCQSTTPFYLPPSQPSGSIQQPLRPARQLYGSVQPSYGSVQSAHRPARPPTAQRPIIVSRNDEHQSLLPTHYGNYASVSGHSVRRCSFWRWLLLVIVICFLWACWKKWL